MAPKKVKLDMTMRDLVARKKSPEVLAAFRRAMHLANEDQKRLLKEAERLK